MRIRPLKELDQEDFPLLIIEDLGMEFPTNISTQKKRFAVFECPCCKRNFRSETTSVKKGRATKCITCATRIKHTTHGEAKTRLHNIWISMRDRCNNTNNIGYKSYGGSGVTVCKEWDSYTNFRDWALLHGYSEELSIDRINVYGNYCPENCRWATATVQARNTRIINIRNTTGFRGVYPEGNTFVASIGINNKTFRLGTFKTKLDAAKCYDKFVIDNNLEHTINGVVL